LLLQFKNCAYRELPVSHPVLPPVQAQSGSAPQARAEGESSQASTLADATGERKVFIALKPGLQKPVITSPTQEQKPVHEVGDIINPQVCS